MFISLVAMQGRECGQVGRRRVSKPQAVQAQLKSGPRGPLSYCKLLLLMLRGSATD